MGFVTPPMSGLRLVGRLIPTGPESGLAKAQFIDIPKLLIHFHDDGQYYNDGTFSGHWLSDPHYTFEPRAFDGSGHLFQLLDAPPEGYLPEIPTPSFDF